MESAETGEGAVSGAQAARNKLEQGGWKGEGSAIEALTITLAGETSCAVSNVAAWSSSSLTVRAMKRMVPW